MTGKHVRERDPNHLFSDESDALMNAHADEFRTNGDLSVVAHVVAGCGWTYKPIYKSVWGLRGVALSHMRIAHPEYVEALR